MVSPHESTLRTALQSQGMLPTCVCPHLLGYLRAFWHIYKRPLRGSEFEAAYVSDGSVPAKRGGGVTGSLQPSVLSIAA